MGHAGSDFIQFLGRFHPALVHLPIGFLVLLAAMEALSLRPSFKDLSRSGGIMLALTVPITIASAVCGWLLSLSGGYDAQLVAWHKWTGIGLAAATVLLLILRLSDKIRSYRVALLATMILLGVTGHFGGSLTHGRGYLTEFAPRVVRQWLGRDSADRERTRGAADSLMKQPIYRGAIQPVFNQNCVACHGPEKSKAGLRLDSLDNLLKGAESGPVIVAGDAVGSLLLKRLRLPLEDEDHMPPEGKRQPSDEQIALLQWWIEIGAPVDKTPRELSPPPSIRRILDPAERTLP